MEQTRALLKALGTLSEKRRSLEQMTRRLAEQERQVMASLERMLSNLGYRVVAVDGKADNAATRSSAPKRRHLARQNLKCSKCDRRFGFVMHLARHMKTVHGAKKRAGKSAAAA